MTETRLDPICALCTVHACCAEPGTKTPPRFCPQPAAEKLLQEIAERYRHDQALRDLAVASARTEASGYMRRTRIEDTMDFARRIGAHRLGIAHCIGLMHEARAEALSSTSNPTGPTITDLPAVPDRPVPPPRC
jgi:uncharacterized metal-binding protein